jgi:hypothetical protein
MVKFSFVPGLNLEESELSSASIRAASLIGAGKLKLQQFAFVGGGCSWVPSPLVGEGQGEGKSNNNESIHPKERRWG